MQNLILERELTNNVFLYKKNRIESSSDIAIIVENLVAGICGTDLDLVKKIRPDLALVLGHEGIGRIVAVNNVVSENFLVGDLVVYNPVSPLNQDHILGHSYSGIFQKFTTISREDLKHQLIIKLPSNTPHWLGAILEPLSIASYAYEIINTVNKPHNVLIIGTGVISHVIAFFLLKQNCNITMISHSSSRVNALNNKNDLPINYIHHSEIEKLTTQFDTIFCCLSRSASMQAFHLALKLAHQGCVIDLVNGFNVSHYITVIDNDSTEKEVDIKNIRRANWCGKNKEIFKIKNMINSNECYITGHRGNGINHFMSALKEINQYPDHYYKLIEKHLHFDSLGDFFNNKSSLDINHRGKILVQIKET